MVDKEQFNIILLIILVVLQSLSLYFTLPYKIKKRIERILNPPRQYNRRQHDIQ